MSYFLIYGDEDGLQIKEFSDVHSVQKRLEMWDGRSIKFWDGMSDEIYNCEDGHFLLIKGKAIIPKPIDVVKTFEIE